MQRRILMTIATLLLSAAAVLAQEEETRLLRYPDIAGDRIAFVYGGDLWVADAAGGTARQLTSHPGEELFPKFSPDGKWIAFTGQYNDNRQVHVISADGGMPRQLTFRNDIGVLPPRGGYDNQVLGWTPDGKQVLFKANRVPYSERNGRPYLVPAAGGMEVPLRVPESASGTLSPDGTKLVYTPIMREFRTWKRYRGGRAQDLWIYDLAKDSAEKITDFEGTDNQPVWIGNTVYFTSDRGDNLRLNLYALDLGGRQVRQVTNHDTFDVLWPSGDDRRIVYENGGWIYLLDPASGQSRRVSIRVPGDRPQALPFFKNVREQIQTMGVSPTGKRAVFSARGDIFTVPAQKGEIRNLTETPGIREMDPAWSPDGRWVAYLSDRSGEYEIYLRRGDGSGDERRITTDGDTWRFPPLWSPDSKKLAFSDTKHRLRVLDIASGKITEADLGTRNDFFDYKWAPDSRWLTYTKVGESQLPSVWVYSLDKGKAWQLTSDLTSEAEPVFDPQGRYLFFLSNRDFNLTFSGFEFDYLYTDPTRVYVAVLKKEGPALFLPQSDEEVPTGDEDALKVKGPQPPRNVADPGSPAAQGSGAQGGSEAADSAPAKRVRVEIDTEGFEQRVRAIPGPSGDYRNLSVGPGAVFYLTGQGPQTQLKMYSLKDQKEEVVLEGIQAYQLSADHQKILYQQGNDYGIVDAKPGQKAGSGKLALDRMEMRIDPPAEWRELYADAWRILRDFF